MNSSKVVATALVLLMFAGVASAAQPRSTAWDKVKVCSNDTHEITVTYDLLDYANGTGNKIIIVKKLQVTFGPSVGVLSPPDSTLKVGPYTLYAGSNLPQTVIIDVVNGSNDRDFENPAHYSVITNCYLN